MEASLDTDSASETGEDSDALALKRRREVRCATDCHNAFNQVHFVPVTPSTALDSKRPELRQLIARYGVSVPRVFGSVLTGTDTADSDLDLLVEPSETTTLFTLASLQDEAEALLGFPVSILTPNALPVAFRDRVLADARPL